MKHNRAPEPPEPQPGPLPAMCYSGKIQGGNQKQIQRPKCSNISLSSMKRCQGLFVLPLWKKQRHPLKGWMKDEYKELIWNQSSPVCVYCFRNPAILMMNLFSKQCRSFWGEFHLSQLHSVPCSVELSRPPALCETAWTSQSWACAKLAELLRRHPQPAAT